MRLLLLATGSTGDVQPMAALARALASRGHDVTLMAFEALAPLAEGTGARFVPLPVDAGRYIGSVIRPGSSAWTYIGRLTGAIRGAIEPMFERMLAGAEGMDAVVATFFGASIYAICQSLGVPLFEVSYCLTDTTGDACLPVLAQPRWPGALRRPLNRATYRVAYGLISGVERRYVAPLCRARGMASRTMAHGPNYQIGDWTVPVLYACSGHMVPRPPEWPDNLHITGFFIPPEAKAEPVNPALQAFLDAGETPVYIGFGSMKSGDMALLRGMLAQALAETRLRAVIAPGWSDLPAEGWGPGVYALEGYVPHAWLLPRVRAIVHHGGAGTTAAGLRAGLPTLIVPFGGDQFYWGDRVHTLGCGPAPLLRRSLRGDRLAQALRELVDTPAYAENARRMQALLLAEDGCARAADIIEDSLAGRVRPPAP